MKKKYIIIFFSVSLVIVLIVCFFLINRNKGDVANSASLTQAAASIIPSPTPTPTPLIYDPLNGIPLDAQTYNDLSKNRPLAVMIPNTPEIRPQSGLNKADVVYEALAEGPITRFMAIFWSDQSDYRLMPIRSVRVYYLRWLLEYNDILLANTGYAQTDDPNTNAYAILKNYNVKTFVWDFSKVFTYDPTCLNSPTIPGWNCAYSTSQKLWNYADNVKGWSGQNWSLPVNMQWKFKDEAPLVSRGNSANNINITFLYKNDTWSVNWVYNSRSNLYMREDNNKKPMMDADTNTQLNTKTLVVQLVPFKMTHDPKNRSIQDNIGTGKAYVFEDGNVTVDTWKKDDITSRTRYYDANGNEISLDRGRIWITQIPDTQQVIYGP